MIASNYIPSAIFFIIIGLLSLRLSILDNKPQNKKQLQVIGTSIFVVCSLIFAFLVVQQSITVRQDECSFCYAEATGGICSQCGLPEA